jgi:hypothetical protein
VGKPAWSSPCPIIREVLAASLDRAVLESAIQDIHLRDPGLVYLLEGQGQVIAYTGEQFSRAT